MNAPQSREIARYWPLLEQLPQWRVVDEADALTWLSTVINNDADRVDWHIKRLHGWGGSEIGALLAQAEGRGISFPDQAVDVLVEQKLLRRAPSKANMHMRRGVLYEPMVRAQFRQAFEVATVQPAIELRASGEFGVDDDAPRWARMNPDDVLRMTNGELWLPDYKAPSVVSPAVSFEYQSQLHYYAAGVAWGLIGVEKHTLGRLPDRLLSVQWDCVAAQPRVFEVDWDPTLVNRMVGAGAAAWHLVLEGIVPNVEHMVSLADVPEVVFQSVNQITGRVILTKAAIKALELERDRDQVLLGEIVSRYEIEGTAPMLGGAGNLRIQPRAIDVIGLYNSLPASDKTDGLWVVDGYDTTALVSLLEAQGISSKSYANRSLDATAVLDAARAAGIDERPYLLERSATALASQKKKGPQADALAALTGPAKASVLDAIHSQFVVHRFDEATAPEPLELTVAAARAVDSFPDAPTRSTLHDLDI